MIFSSIYLINFDGYKFPLTGTCKIKRFLNHRKQSLGVGGNLCYYARAVQSATSGGTDGNESSSFIKRSDTSNSMFGCLWLCVTTGKIISFLFVKSICFSCFQNRF